ncbi:MAG: hypothetical protein IK114_02660 [Fibrobacter sp.]|nr:hypothetical protein [Fibrobacter sp.]
MAVTLESLRKSVGKKNSNSMVFAWLADLERVAGELDKALQRVDGGLTLYPNDISARLVRAKILIQLEAYEPCVEECERIIVMDPFNLAAQRIMGDAYDKLGMLAERNVCYRRLHDMDPLNNFWKEEYDVVLESTAAAAAVGAAADSEFVMSDSTQDLGQASADNMSSLDMSFEDNAEPSTEDAGTESFEMPATEDSIDSPAESDDPFASLAAMLPNGDAAEDSTMEDLSASLESAMDSIKTDESETLAEEFGTEENISGSDVSSALSDMFGLDDDLEPEESTSASPFSNAAASGADIPASIDDNALSNAASVFDTPAAEDKPQSIDDAFGDIFGEDELPEEKPQQQAEPQKESPFGSIEDLAESPLNEGIEDLDGEGDSLFEKSAEVSAPAEETAPVEDKPQSIDDAFGDIFGEDELPEEKPQAEAAPQEESLELPAEPAEESLGSDEGGLFEKSASADMNLTGDDDLSLAEPAAPVDAVAEEKPAEDAPTTIDNAFDSIFGDDELPEEKPAEDSLNLESPIDNLFADDKPAAEEELKLDDDNVAEDAPALESPIDNLFADDAPVAEPAAEAPVAEAPAAEEPALEETPAVVQSASDSSFSVDSAFDSIFGADEDLPEEKPAEAAAPAEAQPALEETESLEEQVNKAEAELEMPEVKAESSDLAKEMGGAFASMFGNADDDLDLPETPATPTKSNEQELTGAPIEEGFAKSADVAEEALESDIDKSFDNLFGKEDDLPTEGDSAAVEAPAAQAAPADVASAAPEAPAAEPAQDLDSLESEVSGAFKGLFDMDDDALTEETKPSNKGVDFLMSGDSDDEISAGLINDPDAPLDRGAQDLDDSLNTRTLAEIYFDQGLYGKALEIYKDLAQKEPDNEDIAVRLSEVEKLYNDKFGGNA